MLMLGKEIKSKKPDIVIKSTQQKRDGGDKFDAGKLRLDLISVPAIEGTAEILTFGSIKYGDRNWEKGLSWSRVFGALIRHLFKWWMRKDIDEESGKEALDHASCCLMFLQHYSKFKKYEKFDDRPKYEDTK